MYCSFCVAHRSCQFVYSGSLGAICRTQNNRDSIFSSLGREPTIHKVPKYGMRDPHMPYKIHVHTLYRLISTSPFVNFYIAEV